MSARPLPLLSALEARALAVLVEKERTVPDTYPLTLNALTAGCNQKSSRNPLFNATESEVQAAIDTLKRYSMVIESSGGRVMRYAQNVKRVFELPSQSVALLATLVLRGPQTAGELRINSDRLNRFSDISAVEGFLNEMAERPAGALAVELPRQPGTRETRWVHLLSGAPAGIDETGSAMGSGTAGAILSLSDAAALNTRVAALEGEVTLLKRTVERLCAELGLPSPVAPDAGAAVDDPDS
ncbi:MAG: YceH family protein [Gammaproteobacteria bacterium]